MQHAVAEASPVAAQQILPVQVGHRQPRGRELVEILHGARARRSGRGRERGRRIGLRSAPLAVGDVVVDVTGHLTRDGSAADHLTLSSKSMRLRRDGLYFISLELYLYALLPP